MSNRWFTEIAAFSLLLGMTALVGAGETETQSADLFKQLDKNNDGKVTKDELNEKQSKFFARLVRTGDNNGDGELSKEEFRQAVNRKEQPVEVKAGSGRSKRGINPERLFKKFDKNGDGKISKEELPEKLRERLAPLFKKLGKDEISMKEFAEAAKRFRGKDGRPKGDKKDPKKLFDLFDKNGDGEITLEELPEKLRKRLKPLFEKSGKDALTPEDFAKLRLPKGAGYAERFFKRLDKNGDGEIQKDEVPEKFRERFAEMDVNGDGTLDKEEMKKMIRRPPGKKPEKKNEKNPAEIARRIMSQLDKDGDGKIQRAEAGRRLEERFDQFDTNGDGELDLEELQKGIKSQEGDRPDKRKRPRKKGGKDGKRPEKRED